MTYEDYLMHFNPNHDPRNGQFAKAPIGTRIKAKRDAKEFARAKMYYGEGAGNRRKLIRAKVESRSSDPAYKNAFDTYLSKQDMADHASKAKTERRIKNAGNAAGKTARGIYHITARDGAKVASSVVITYGALKMTGLDKKMVEVGRQALSNVMSRARSIHL